MDKLPVLSGDHSVYPRLRPIAHCHGRNPSVRVSSVEQAGREKIRKGEALEAARSAREHARGVPLLCSSLLLRRLGAGQVDVAVVTRQGITLFECKSAGRPAPAQRRRLRHTSDFLARVLKMPVRRMVAKSPFPS